MPLINVACNTILIHINGDTTGSSLLISNINLLLVSLGFCYANMYAAKVSMSRLMSINCSYENGHSLLRHVVTITTIIILKLVVNSNSINFLTLTIIFLPYKIAFIKFSILPSCSTTFEASMAENDESAPILTPTSACLNMVMSSWQLPVMQHESPISIIMRSYISLDLGQQLYMHFDLDRLFLIKFNETGDRLGGSRLCSIEVIMSHSQRIWTPDTVMMSSNSQFSYSDVSKLSDSIDFLTVSDFI